MSKKYAIAQLLEETLEGYSLDDKIEGLRIVTVELYNEKYAEELDLNNLAGMPIGGNA